MASSAIGKFALDTYVRVRPEHSSKSFNGVVESYEPPCYYEVRISANAPLLLAFERDMERIDDPADEAAWRLGYKESRARGDATLTSIGRDGRPIRLQVGASEGIDVAAIMKGWDVQTAKAYKTLAEHGWYPDGDWWSGQASAIALAFASGSGKEGDEAMCLYVDSRLQEFERKFGEAHPKRSRFVGDAFEAHRSGKYTLSIPSLFAQADGICWDTLGEQLYAKDRQTGNLKIAEIIAPLPTIGGGVAPLLEAFPIVWSEKRRARSGRSVLNRHAVLHGESVDYDTRLRSCQAVSLLQYVGWIMPHIGRTKKFAESDPKMAEALKKAGW